jgi:photosystem II stability/assembly factor-like uncharacterized protein
MMKPRPQLRFLVIILFLIALLFAVAWVGGGFKDTTGTWIQSESVFATGASPAVKYYYPIIFASGNSSTIELVDAWTRVPGGDTQQFFYLGDTIEYVSTGINHLDHAALVLLTWTLEGPCGSTEIFRKFVMLSPGTWQHAYSQVAPDCSGSYTATVQINYLGETSTLAVPFQVFLPGQVITTTGHGFDRCTLPTPSQMQTWWDNSPYSVWNIYLGGIHFYCPTADLNISWVQSVTQQGWQFILTWVGPQAPCSTKTYRFSSNTTTAYGQGIDEAAAALARADSLGITGDKIIYYDLETYPNPDTTCKNAVNAFLQGWTDWLHLQGDKSGVYAAPCYNNSNMADWWFLNSPPDDVWIAHWLLPAGYRPDATVWTICLPDSYWPDHQRLRQYSGDYSETWGGVTMGIDSDVLDGEITALSGTLPTAGLSPETTSQPPQIREMDLITSQVGWVLLGDRLLITEDGAIHWREIPPDLRGAAILDVAFLDAVSGWLVALRSEPVSEAQLSIYQTSDGGTTWNAYPLSVPAQGIAAAYLDFVDAQTGWLVFKMVSGSSFSLGELYVTLDGGITWERRSAPMGEPATFIDAQHGWMTGGPARDRVYQTWDGGTTWTPLLLPGLPDTGAFIGEPIFGTPTSGFLPVTLLGQPDSQLVLYATDNGGETWTTSQNITLPPGYQPGEALPFSLQSGKWWAATPASSNLYISENLGRDQTRVSPTGLSSGVIVLDFATEEVGWALVQDGKCFGAKIPANLDIPDADPFSCMLQSRLFMTTDGGIRWVEIKL